MRGNRGNRWPAVRVVALIGLVTAGFTGLELGIRLAAEAAGTWGVLTATILFPATIAAAPAIALALGQWLPAVVVYGGGFTAGVLYARGERARDTRPRTAVTS